MSRWIPLAQAMLKVVSLRPDLFEITQMSDTDSGFHAGRRRRWQSRLGRVLGVRLFSHQYEGVIGRVHVHDAMLTECSAEHISHYIHVGRNAVRNIEEVLKAAGRSFEDIKSCLDMACGSGRVLRVLQTHVPASRITACDVDEEAVRFVASEFGVKTIVSRKDLQNLHLPENYDLIWVGSLFSHLRPETAFPLFERLVGHLQSGGILVFTTHGEWCLNRLPEYGESFASLKEQMRESLEQSGFAYAPYSSEQDCDYGTTLYRSDWLQEHMKSNLGGKIQMVSFSARGWDNHQDVYGFQRNSRSDGY